MTRILIALALLLSVWPAALQAAQEQQAGTTESARDREQFEQSMKERLGKLGARLDELKKDADARSTQVERNLKGHLADAEQKRHAAEQKLKELGTASRDSWRKFSAEMERAAKDFEQSFERALNQKK